MFSEELYQPDRNTVQYMIDEMQDELNTTHSQLDTAHAELDAVHSKLDVAKDKLIPQQGIINEMNGKYNQSIKNIVSILRGIGLSDQEIVSKLCGQYQFNECQAKEYL